ncbi:AsmA family protein, partial [Desulfovibrio sp. OttesenSCG-928-F20]|nr:AsmA family protein [Desulfovibrio sp. OttesenSCG-928-F20]
GTFRKKEWKLRIASAKAVGKGAIYAVLEKGVRLSGNWSLNASGMRTPWQSGVKDSLAGTYNGVLHWPPIFGGPPKKDAKPERKTVERVTGKVDAAGRVTLPEVLGSFALNGELTTDFDWSVTGDRLVFEGAEFKGHGGALETGVEIDLSGAQSIMRASPSFTANPSRLLRDWNIAIPKGLRVPGLLTGRLDLLMKGDSLSLDKLKVEMDGAPITGSINLVPAPKGSPDVSDTWVLRLAAQHLDIEKILPPKPQGDKTPPSKTPWKLDFFQKLSLDAQISLYNAKKGKLSFDRSNITALAQRDRFSMECDTRDFYGGTSLIIIQGTVVPGSSHVTLRKGLVHMQNVSLGGLLHDMTGKQSYAGTAELVADLKGVLGCNADIPGKLSGNWSLNIKDGMYPGFLTSEDSTLRNTFSLAKASGPMENGVLRSGNFTLSGAMVDMAGAGWYDLRNNNMDFEVSVTFAKIPTVPVRFYGNAASPHMKVRGVDMVVETMQAAGSTILGLVVGVLELPGRAFQGISNLFGGQSSGKKNKQAPQTMPVKPTGRR